MIRAKIFLAHIDIRGRLLLLTAFSPSAKMLVVGLDLDFQLDRVSVHLLFKLVENPPFYAGKVPHIIASLAISLGHSDFSCVLPF